MDLFEAAKQLGFVAMGVSPCQRPLFFDPFRAWVAAGKQGDMAWLARHMDIREDPGRLLEGCRSVVSLAYPYSVNRPATPDGYVAARYTEPRRQDYHDRLRESAKQVARLIETNYPGAKTRVCVDSAPLLERSFAYASGLGFIGKNNMLIVPGYGSYVFLAEVLTTARIPGTGHGAIQNPCGDCRRCVEACPTGALEKPFGVDAAKCLSYLTIEMKQMVDEKTGEKMGRCFFGCDRCQEVCPFNPKESREDVSLPPVKSIQTMDEPSFRSVFGKTAFARAGLTKIRGNIAAMTGGCSPGEGEDGIL